jgi:putative PIN family toxin of toxin-antitoxin system
MLKVVVDTNQFVSSVIAPAGLSRKLIDGWRQREFILLTSPAIIEEIARVLRYPRIRDRYRIDEADVAGLVALLETDATLLPGTTEIGGIADDPDDDVFLACAVEGKADYIVSGDPHLLSLSVFRGVPIVTVREFLDRVRLRPPEPGTPA